MMASEELRQDRVKKDKESVDISELKPRQIHGGIARYTKHSCLVCSDKRMSWIDRIEKDEVWVKNRMAIDRYYGRRP
jgi:hypothetical protein